MRSSESTITAEDIVHSVVASSESSALERYALALLEGRFTPSALEQIAMIIEEPSRGEAVGESYGTIFLVGAAKSLGNDRRKWAELRFRPGSCLEQLHRQFLQEGKRDAQSLEKLLTDPVALLLFLTHAGHSKETIKLLRSLLPHGQTGKAARELLQTEAH